MAVSVVVDTLTKTYGKAHAVDRVSLTIEPGELFFLLGPSGCGKTTLLRCVAGFCEPDSGSISLGDHDITHMPPHERDTGMVFQSYALWPHLTVGQNVAFGLEMRKRPADEIRRRVAEVLDLVHMAERASARPNQLSGGQQQRVALARALVVHPRCLLLDEPLSNLDAKLRLDMRAEIRRICKDVGLTAIYVTHDQKEALSMADRLAVMDKGRVIQTGTPCDVYQRPANRFVAGFMGEANFTAGNVVDVRADAVTVHTPVGRLLAACPDNRPDAGARVTACIRPEAVHIGAAPAGAPNAFCCRVLESIYLGEVAQYVLAFPNGEAPEAAEDAIRFKAFDLNPRRQAGDSVAELSVWIDPEDVILLES